LVIAISPKWTCILKWREYIFDDNFDDNFVFFIS